jgi:hypothetical protein
MSSIFKGLGDFLQPVISPPIQYDDGDVFIGQVLDVGKSSTNIKLNSADITPLTTPTMIGTIRFNKAGDGKQVESSVVEVAQPLDRSNYRLPFPGDQVLIVRFAGRYYYFQVITGINQIVNPGDPGLMLRLDEVEGLNRSLLERLTDSGEIAAKRFFLKNDFVEDTITQPTGLITKPREGETIFEGRMGGVIKLTHTITKEGIWDPEKQIANIGQSVDGDPMMVIKASIRTKQLNVLGEQTNVLEDDDINQDESSFYLTSTQLIPMQVSVSKRMASWDIEVTNPRGLQTDTDLTARLQSFFPDQYDPTDVVTANVTGVIVPAANANQQQQFTGTFSGENAFIEGSGGYPPNAKDADFATKYTNGILPAVLYRGDNTYVVATYPTDRSSLKNRHWFQTNDLFTKNLAPVVVPLRNNKTITVRVMPEFANILNKAFATIAGSPLREYMVNCGGGFAVRNVTGGTRLTNHAWGFAIDLNSDVYPYGFTGFKNGASVDNPKYPGHAVKHREIANILVSAGATWLEDGDPHHFSIHE